MALRKILLAGRELLIPAAATPDIQLKQKSEVKQWEFTK
jgi:hypothetical protein